MPVKEEQALEACRQGDLKQFGILYDAYVRKIYNFVFFKTHHKEMAEDIVSQVFLKALEHIRHFNPATGSFSSWLYRIARNAVIDYYRTKRTAVAIEDAWDISAAGDLGTMLDRSEHIERVRNHLAAFSAIERDIVIMRVWQELSYKEIAAVIGKSEDNCKMIFSRALARLKKKLPVAVLVALLFQRLV